MIKNSTLLVPKIAENYEIWLYNRMKMSVLGIDCMPFELFLSIGTCPDTQFTVKIIF